MYKELIEVAKRIASIARARENDKNYNESDPFCEPDKYHKLFMQELGGLELDSILVLQAIMYLGRDRDYNPDFSPDEIFSVALKELKSTPAKEKEVEISQLVDSMHVGSYLREGYKILGINI